MSNPADFDTGNRGAAVASLALERMMRSPAHLIEALPVGIYSCDRDGRLVQFNRRAAALWDGLTLGEPAPGADDSLAEVLACGQPVRDREFVVVRPHAEPMTLLANADPLFDEPAFVVEVARQIGELRGVAVEEIGLRTTENFARFFRQTAGPEYERK